MAETKRIASVDALRGFDMLWIIGGGDIAVTLAKATNLDILRGVPAQFEHSWEKFYDLLMPLLLFIVGVVMPLAFRKRLERGAGKRVLYVHVVKRVVILWVPGLVTSGHLLEFDLLA